MNSVHLFLYSPKPGFRNASIFLSIDRFHSETSFLTQFHTPFVMLIQWNLYFFHSIQNLNEIFLLHSYRFPDLMPILLIKVHKFDVKDLLMSYFILSNFLFITILER